MYTLHAAEEVEAPVASKEDSAEVDLSLSGIQFVATYVT